MLPLLAAGRAAAQLPAGWDYADPRLSRAQLQQMRMLYAQAAVSPAYSQRLQSRAQQGLTEIDRRLALGDFRVGDRILLSVEGTNVPPTLTDTFLVATGPMLELPGAGRVALAGVLRQELEPNLRSAVERVFRGAAVRARPLVRLAVLGGVSRPGFYGASSDDLIEDVITAAGGPVGDALLSEARIERGSREVWRPDSLQAAMMASRPIGEMALQDGDRIIVPRQGPRDLERMLRAVSIAVSLPFSILALGRLF